MHPRGTARGNAWGTGWGDTWRCAAAAVALGSLLVRCTPAPDASVPPPASDRVGAWLDWDAGGKPRLQVVVSLPSAHVLEALSVDSSAPRTLLVTAALLRGGRDAGGQSWVLPLDDLRPDLEAQPRFERAFWLDLAPGTDEVRVACFLRGRADGAEWRRRLTLPREAGLLLSELRLGRNTAAGSVRVLDRFYEPGTGAIRVEGGLVQRDAEAAPPDSFSLAYVVRTDSARVVVRAGTRIARAGITTPWTIDFAQPGPGAYALEVEARAGAQRATATTRFEVGVGDLRTWAGAGVELLALLLPAEELARIRAAPDAERNALLAAYWQRLDPDPATAANEHCDEIARRIQHANQTFTAARSGWRTDRGRVYIRFGAPDEVEALGSTSGTSRLERWTYHAGGQVFVFQDASGGGDFVLLRSNVPDL
jgi:GWxTD domain-containing protein